MITWPTPEPQVRPVLGDLPTLVSLIRLSQIES